jgi:mono/diheme cytochrome c family protein
VRRLIIGLVLLSLLLAGCGRTTRGKFGSELYDISCAGCHGDSGEGNVLGPAVGTVDSRSALEFDDSQIFGAIRVGPGSMPGNPYLTDAQITSLVDLLRSLQQSGAATGE